MSYPGQKPTSHDPVHSFTFRMIAGVFLLLCAISLILVNSANADGGGPEPTNTRLPAAMTLPALNPTPTFTQTSVTGAQSAPSLLMSTPEVKSFDIIIDTNQNATVQPVTSDNQLALYLAQTQTASTSQEEGFASPLWIFGFFAVVILILVFNSIGRSFRSKS